jgi:hypothetical protein
MNNAVRDAQIFSKPIAMWVPCITTNTLLQRREPQASSACSSARMKSYVSRLHKPPEFKVGLDVLITTVGKKVWLNQVLTQVNPLEPVDPQTRMARLYDEWVRGQVLRGVFTHLVPLTSSMPVSIRGTGDEGGPGQAGAGLLPKVLLLPLRRRGPEPR